LRITIFGSGYVGLVTGACFADVGHIVTCVDVDTAKIKRLRNGDVVIYEPGLADLVTRNLAANRLFFTADAADAVASADIIFIAVGTPADEDGSADLRSVLAVAHTIGATMSVPKIVVDKSTVPVGTAEKVRDAIAEQLRAREVDVPFEVCSNPEFLKEGSAIADFTRAARIIVGTDSALVRDAMQRCYAPYNRNHNKMMFMDIRSAELTKYAANAMLATRISFMNEIARLAERLGADIEQVRLGVGSDPRIGFDFLYAGAGYGGSCFPKDVRALAHTARSVGHEPLLLNAVEAVNAAQKNWLFDKLSQGLEGSVEGKTIAVWGLSFKPNTDDMREAPSQVVIQSLLANGALVQAFDPQARHEAERIWGTRNGLRLVSSADEALSGADALVICTEWATFRGADLAAVKASMKGDLIVDGRNLYEPAAARDAGLRYLSVGRSGA
jgi:UDPglucose 6-dehydrogenase